jgi:hypothetical protein
MNTIESWSLSDGERREIARKYCARIVDARINNSIAELPSDAWLNVELRERGCPDATASVARSPAHVGALAQAHPRHAAELHPRRRAPHLVFHSVAAPLDERGYVPGPLVLLRSTHPTRSINRPACYSAPPLWFH